MSERYELSHAEIHKVKKAAKIMGLDWRPIAARPSQALSLIDCIKQARDKRAGSCFFRQRLNPSVADYHAGCERWSAISRAKDLLERWRAEK
tara:strand:+ start:81 stop:356 length:276 start_codon:yes stop_codon:yes gene_type:complete